MNKEKGGRGGRDAHEIENFKCQEVLSAVR